MVMTAKERERAFLIGAPLAIVPALCFLPAVMFLIVFPRVAHGRLIGSLAVLACALIGGFVCCACTPEERPDDFSVRPTHAL